MQHKTKLQWHQQTSAQSSAPPALVKQHWPALKQLMNCCRWELLLNKQNRFFSGTFLQTAARSRETTINVWDRRDKEAARVSAPSQVMDRGRLCRTAGTATAHGAAPLTDEGPVLIDRICPTKLNEAAGESRPGRQHRGTRSLSKTASENKRGLFHVQKHRTGWVGKGF